MISIFFTSLIADEDTLIFGAIATIEPHLMEKKLTPLMHKIEKATGKKVVFQTGYDYDDTINKFANATFDIGYIGPIPYIKAVLKNPKGLRILAGIKNSQKKPFRSVIISKKDSRFKTLQDLKDSRFAFGSPNSTLSYYVPKYMLYKADMLNQLRTYHFLGRHDKVAQYVIMGKYDAGALKQSVATKYAKYIQVIATSKAYPGFMIVANSSMDKELVEKIRAVLFNPKNATILKSVKKSAIGFEKRKDSDYNELRKIMKVIESLE